MFRRRTFLAAALAALAAPAAAQNVKPGVLLMHGKGSGPQFPALRKLADALGAAGFPVETLGKAWARDGSLQGNVEATLDEIGGHLDKLARGGATKLFLAGHSLGATAAMAFAAKRGRVAGVAMIATGHVPRGYFLGQGASAPVRESILAARAMAAAGKGAEIASFADNNQGRTMTARMTADDYLSWFDPDLGFDPRDTMAQAPCPVLFAIGRDDILFPIARTQFFDKLPPDPRHKFLEMAGGHIDGPAAASDATAGFLRSLL
ncbi:MAG: alpha/beta hydrolase [Alphaproteobacteria bacterium]|nr:alpha/beta hydrolase [Alphaproteobacteria bacterium]